MTFLPLDNMFSWPVLTQYNAVLCVQNAQLAGFGPPNWPENAIKVLSPDIQLNLFNNIFQNKYPC